MRHVIVVAVVVVVAASMTDLVASLPNETGFASFSTQGGGRVPLLAFGTAGFSDANIVLTALEEGFRHIDTAQLYGNERAVGEALKQSGLPRERVFLTTKVAFLPGGLYKPWCWFLETLAGYGADACRLMSKGNELPALQQSMRDLNVSQVDLCLLHTPFAAGMAEFLAAYLPHRLGRHKPFSLSFLSSFAISVRHLLANLVYMVGLPGPEATAVRQRSWAALEDAKLSGKCRYIGVSNYDAELLQELESSARILPAVNQLEFHPLFQARETIKHCRARGIAVMAYGNSISMHNFIATEIAKRRSIPAAQVTLSWILQWGVVAVTRSSRRDGMRENLAALNLTLTPMELQALNGLDTGMPFYWDAKAVVRDLEQDASEEL